MPSSRLPHHEPLTSHNQTSNPALRPSSSATSTRTRQQHDLFAPSLSRRHGGRTTPRIEDEVLADSESEHDLVHSGRQRVAVGIRYGSPEGKHLRTKGTRQQAQEQDIVNRKPDGSYLLDGSMGGTAVSAASTLFPQAQVTESPEDLQAYDAALARRYFTSGVHFGRRTSKQTVDEFEEARPAMMARLREEVMAKLENDRWLYEPADRFQGGL